MARYVYSALAYCLAGCVLQNHGLVAAGVWALTYSPMARVLPALTGPKTKARGYGVVSVHFNSCGLSVFPSGVPRHSTEALLL